MTTTQQHNESEVAAITARIAAECEASQRGLTGSAIVAQHAFIEAKLRHIGECFEALKTMMPPEEAIAIVADAMASVDAGGHHATP